MLVLQGLADRTAVFHPLPEGGISFLDVASQEDGKVHIVNEIDNVLDTGREPFRQWQRRLCDKLRPGMRIVGAFSASDWWDANRSEYRYGDHSRVAPRGASAPEPGHIYRIEERRGQDLLIRYARTDTRWDHDEYGNWGEQPYKNRATCTLHPDDPFILPLDLVTLPELTTYLHARTERHAYLSIIPLIKAAITALQAQADAERPFRLLLAGRIAEMGDLDVNDALAEMDALVRWWKLTNRWHRPLVGEPQVEAKAVQAICREWEARRSTPAASIHDGQIVTSIRDQVPGAICVARRRDGRYAAYQPADDGQRLWLTIHTFTATGKLSWVREWTMVPGRTLASQRDLWWTPAWQEWDHGASAAEHLTGPEQVTIVDQLRDRIAPHGTPIAVMYQPAGEYFDDGRTFMVIAWHHTPRAVDDDKLKDPGERMCTISAQWRRDSTGAPALTIGRLREAFLWHRYSSSRHSTPWRPADSAYQYRYDWRLVWSDPDQLTAVEQVSDAIATQEAVRRARSHRAWKLREFLQLALMDAEEKRLRIRFLQDHAGAEDLWKEHRETLRITHPDMRWAEDLTTWLVHQSIDLSNMTVGEAAALYGQPVHIPAELNHVRFNLHESG
ncbi:hypothetical protein AB0J43_00170 [Nonomuraea fuscirosea]